MFSKILLSALLLLGLISSALGSLGVTKDNSLGKSVKAYNSKCTVNKRPSDNQFLKMVETAYHEMNSSLPDNKNKKYDMPYAMIGLAIEDEVYFASSVKAGKKALIYESRASDGTQFTEMPKRYQEVLDALKKCTADNKNKPPQHGNFASCGEIMSTILWMHDHDPESPKDHDPRVAAWCRNGYLPPCSSGENEPRWGCHDWTKVMKYRVIGNIERHDFDEPKKCEPVSLHQCLEVSAKEKEENAKATQGSS